MLNMNRFLMGLKGTEVVIKLRIGKIQCVIDDVGHDGTLKVSKVKIIETSDETLREWEDKEGVVIRKDSVVAVFLE